MVHFLHCYLLFQLCPSSLSEETIMDIIASLMVLPNRMCIPLIDQVKVDQMRFPLPRVRKVLLLFIISEIQYGDKAKLEVN